MNPVPDQRVSGFQESCSTIENLCMGCRANKEIMVVAICNVVNGKEKCQTGKMPNRKVSKFCDFDLSRWPQCVHKGTKKPDNDRTGLGWLGVFGCRIRRDASVSHNFSPLFEVNVANVILGVKVISKAPSNCVGLRFHYSGRRRGCFVYMWTEMFLPERPLMVFSFTDL